MICSTVGEFSPHGFMKISPKVSDKLRTTIRDNFLRNTMKTYNPSEIELHILLNLISGLNWKEMSRLCQSIYNYPDRIIPLRRPGQPGDEIHSNFLPLL